MLSLFLGPDDFSKKNHIAALAQTAGAELEFFIAADSPPALANLLEQDLFAKKKILVLQSLLTKYQINQEILGKLAASKNTVIFAEEKLDKRLAASKLLLSHKQLAVKEFPLPHGAELDAWIVKQVKAGGGSITKAAAALLAKKLGRDDAVETKFAGRVVEVREIYNLWQADSEIRKLIAYAGKAEITEADVGALVADNGEVDALKIVNAIGDRDKDAALALVAEFLRGGDDKVQIIQLNALLSEQFRNVLAVQDLLSRRVSETGILDRTSWKPGRLFIIKKIAARFSAKKVLEFLRKLAALDEELKSASTPPRVLLDLIVSQLLI